MAQKNAIQGESQVKNSSAGNLFLIGLFAASSGVPLASYAAATCQISGSNFYESTFVLRDIVITNDSTPLSSWNVELGFDKSVTGTRVWGDASAFSSAAANKIVVTPSSNTLAAKASASFGFKGTSTSRLTGATCKVINGAATPPPEVTPPPPGTVGKCGPYHPGSVLSQNFESFALGTPPLSGEREFGKQFCIPPKTISGFGNEAEGPLTGKPLADRQAREAKGQYNGASSVVRMGIVSGANVRKGRALQVLYPKGTNTSSHSGAQFDMVIPDAKVYDRASAKIVGANAYQELYISYWVRFSDDFDWAFGGKLPGLYALEGYGFSPRTNEVKSRLMWRENGKLEFYLHTAHDSRERLFWNNVGGKGHATLTKGKWHNIEFRMTMNSVIGGNAQPDGILQGWLDGQLYADYRDLRFRNSTAVNWNAVFFSTFHGGSSGTGGPGEVWWPSRDVTAMFDDVIVSTTPISNY
jgi:hypothetical protein